MKFTIKDRATEEAVKLDLIKHPRNRSISILKEGTREKILELSSSRGRISVAVDEALASAVGMSGAPDPGSPDPVPASANVDELRNWEILAGSMKVYHPRTGHAVELPFAPGGTRVPGPVHEILGQPEMTFAVAFALDKGRHSILVGPTGTGKTSAYRWFAHTLGYNFVMCPISRGTEAAHMVGDYVPTGQALFEWMDGPVTEAIRLSMVHPTILVFDEINRIGNIQEFSRVYTVLDDTRILEISERRSEKGVVERLQVGDLHIAATANPSDDDRADYIGVQDLDPALSSRFRVHPQVDYPPAEVELEALCARVPTVDRAAANKMVQTAKRIRESSDVRFPVSFRELEDWALAMPAFGYHDAARVSVVNKAPRVFRQSIDNLIRVM